MSFPRANILISGAGIAGLTLAFWLERFGFAPTLVEKRPDRFDEGYMIDFYGSGYDVAEKMGLLDPLRERHYPIPTLQFVDDRGRPTSEMNVERFRALLDYRHFNFMRGDLEAVLFEAVAGRVSIHQGTTITSLENRPDGVAVRLSDGREAEFDLVVGADGIHSHVRRLVWGPENRFERFLGYTVAGGIIENFLDRQDAFYSHLAPGLQASVYSIRGGRLATFFAFKSDERLTGGRERQIEVLQTRFGNQGWIVPDLVEATCRAPRFFFDAVSQIELTPWSTGRVALVGDACQCLTLLAGQGAAMAMAGAYLLADALRAQKDDFAAAFQAYEARLKPEIDRRQVEARKLASSFVPDSRFSIWLMGLFLRAAFLPGFRTLFRRQIGAGSLFAGDPAFSRPD